jgi:hypothetical protein
VASASRSNVYETALKDVRKVLSHIPDGLSSQAEGLLAAVELAYENRAGEPLEEQRPKRVKIGGKEWRGGNREAVS